MNDITIDEHKVVPNEVEGDVKWRRKWSGAWQMDSLPRSSEFPLALNSNVILKSSHIAFIKVQFIQPFQEDSYCTKWIYICSM